MDLKNNKTPSYILKAISNYNKKNYEIIKQKRKERYNNMTPEEKKELNKKNIEKQKQKIASMTPKELEDYKEKQKQKRLNKLACMTPEELETYKEKQKQYKINYKLRNQKKQEENKLQNITIDLNSLTIEQ